MRENHFVITLSPELVVTKEEGKLRRNADGSQFISVIPDDWLPNEGEVLYITFAREDSDMEQDVKVGPQQMFYNAKKRIFVTRAPHDLICFAGQWNYSLELRFDITKDKKGEIVYKCLTSSVETLTIIDSIAEATKSDTYTKEAELIGAAKTIADALTVGYTAQDVIDAANDAKASKENAKQSAKEAADSADVAKWALLDVKAEVEFYACNAENSADRAQSASEAATQKAADAAESARKAEEAKQEAAGYEQACGYLVAEAMGWAGEADTYRREADTYRQEAGAAALRASASAQSAKEQAERAALLLEQFASYGIKINTDYSSFAELPIPGNANNIYFIPNGGEGENGYDEYVWVEDKQAYEKIGTTQIDLTSYLSKTEAQETYVTLENLSTEESARTGADEALGVRIDDAESSIEELKTSVSGKADQGGIYPNMTAGKATQADSATKATNDSDGKKISSTYAKQTGTYPNMTVGGLTTPRAIDGVSFDGTAAITHYGTCSTGASTTIKDVQIAGFSLVIGARVAVKFSNTNTASAPQLRVYSLSTSDGTAKTIYFPNSTTNQKNVLAANRIIEFIYDGTNWVMISADPLAGHPVNSLYISVDSTSPAALFGGSWEQIPAGYALWTATSGAGSTIAAGLPNIKGSIVFDNYYYGLAINPEGAFLGSDSGTKSGSTGMSSNNRNVLKFSFDANKSNSIYSDSITTVQPPAYKVYAWRRTA